MAGVSSAVQAYLGRALRETGASMKRSSNLEVSIQKSGMNGK
jgi:hypothetical protein